MTTITVENKDNKKVVTIDGKSYNISMEGDDDLSFMSDKMAVDPIIEMLTKAYEYGRGNQPLVFIQK